MKTNYQRNAFSADYVLKLLLVLLLGISTSALQAQNRKLPIDTTVVSQHSVTINGQAINYTAETGTQPVWDEMGEPIASLHYTYYTRNGVRERASPPLLISFNGRPAIRFNPTESMQTPIPY